MQDPSQTKPRISPNQRTASSFLIGMGSVLDLFGTAPPPPRRLVRFRDAAHALGRDWQVLATDLRKVLNRFEDNPRVKHGQK